MRLFVQKFPLLRRRPRMFPLVTKILALECSSPSCPMEQRIVLFAFLTDLLRRHHLGQPRYYDALLRHYTLYNAVPGPTYDIPWRVCHRWRAYYVRGVSMNTMYLVRRRRYRLRNLRSPSLGSRLTTLTTAREAQGVRVSRCATSKIGGALGASLLRAAPYIPRPLVAFPSQQNCFAFHVRLQLGRRAAAPVLEKPLVPAPGNAYATHRHARDPQRERQ